MRFIYSTCNYECFFFKTVIKELFMGNKSRRYYPIIISIISQFAVCRALFQVLRILDLIYSSQ